MSKTNNAVITFNPMGEYLKAIAANDTVITFSQKTALESGVSEVIFSAFSADAVSLYNETATMMMLREGNISTPDYATLRIAMDAVKNRLTAMFKLCATKKNKSGENVPFYEVSRADFALLGETVTLSRKASKSVKNASAKFAEYLAIMLGRVLSGNALSRLDDDTFTATKALFNAEKAAKSAETKAKKAAEKTATEKKIEVLENTVTETADKIAAAIALIMASHATDDEKAAIVAALNIETVKAENTEKTAA